MKIDRRKFLSGISVGGAALATGSITGWTGIAQANTGTSHRLSDELAADVVILGGGLGGCAAALASLRNGLSVILTEETDWLGGQITQQGVPPDEHQWIETHGGTSTYRQYRSRVREYYVRNYPLTEDAKSRQYLNPGDGRVSRICHEPRVAVAVLDEMLAPYISSGNLTILREYRVQKADVDRDQVTAVLVSHVSTGHQVVLKAPYFVDATELGELLPLTGTEYVTGAESQAETNELHAPAKANPENQQAFTMCLAMDYVPGADNRIDKPRDYDFWRNFVPKMTPPWPGRLLELVYSSPRSLKPRTLGFHPEGDATGDTLNLWNYRKIINRHNFIPGTYQGDVSIINWPQNDYFLGNLIDVSEQEFRKHVEQSKQLSLSLFYWLQTEVPRPDGGQGWPGLRLRGDILGTADGLAKYPYVRESRRIRAVFTVLEEHVGTEQRAMVTGVKEGNKAYDFYDSVGIGYYPIDLHPSSRGNNYIDFSALKFQVPLGALLPIRMKNLLPANKNIGTTHLTNGCYRLHPVEWTIGEAVGMLTAYSMSKRTTPHAVRENRTLLADFQQMVRNQGVETAWPE